MAIYHASIKMISRSAGRSSVAAAAYRSGTCLEMTTMEENMISRKNNGFPMQKLYCRNMLRQNIRIDLCYGML